MSTINLSDAKVSYEGQELPAINLISKLQTQLQEAACRLATIATTLGDLQAALLNSNTVEVKLTLSKEDFGRFRSLGGSDDAARIRKAVMALIYPEAAEISPRPVESRLVATPEESETVSPPVERILREQSIAAEPVVKKKSTTQCPTCRSLIELPEMPKDQWSIEVKCENCGAKCLLKQRL